MKTTLACVAVLTACAAESSKPVATTTPTSPQVNQLGGLGVVLSDQLVVTRVLARSAGCKAGFRVGDTFLEIDAHVVDGTADALPLLRGAPGTQVDVTIERNGARQTIAATRALIDAATVDTDCESPGALTSASGDLDGNGTAETISLVSAKATTHWYGTKDSRFDVMLDRGGAATLVVGNTSWPIELGNGDYVGLRVIDIDASDNRRELMLVRRPNAEEACDVIVFTFDGARLSTTTLERGTWTTVDGSGTLVLEQPPVSDESMMHTTQTRITYQRRGAMLVEHARNTLPYSSD